MPTGWLRALRAYLAMTLGANLAWEAAQLPLYTLWTTGTTAEKVFAVLHCTGGDLLIATSVLVLALLLVGDPAWPTMGHRQVAVLTLVFGLAYTAFSEWLNTVVRSAWAYSELMPVIRISRLEIGVSPLLQWVLLPSFALWWAGRTARQPAPDGGDSA